jgi:hypothetical protein
MDFGGQVLERCGLLWLEVEIVHGAGQVFAPGRTMFATKELIYSLTFSAGGTRRMSGEHPIKQLLFDTRAYWDHEGTPAHVRETFWKIMKCGTIALGAEVYASETESKLVFHTCKSRFCTSCGQRATEAWQADLEAVLLDIPYVGITLTMPMEFRIILHQNRHILHGIPTMGAEALQQWAKARHGARLIVIVVQQTSGGFLNFVPHLHVMVSTGGLREARALDSSS